MFAGFESTTCLDDFFPLARAGAGRLVRLHKMKSAGVRESGLCAWCCVMHMLSLSLLFSVLWTAYLVSSLPVVIVFFSDMPTSAKTRPTSEHAPPSTAVRPPVVVLLVLGQTPGGVGGTVGAPSVDPGGGRSTNLPPSAFPRSLLHPDDDGESFVFFVLFCFLNILRGAARNQNAHAIGLARYARIHRLPYVNPGRVLQQ